MAVCRGLKVERFGTIRRFSVCDGAVPRPPTSCVVRGLARANRREKSINTECTYAYCVALEIGTAGPVSLISNIHEEIGPLVSQFPILEIGQSWKLANRPLPTRRDCDVKFTFSFYISFYRKFTVKQNGPFCFTYVKMYVKMCKNHVKCEKFCAAARRQGL